MGTLQSTSETTQPAYLAAVIGIMLFTSVAYLVTGVESGPAVDVLIAGGPDAVAIDGRAGPPSTLAALPRSFSAAIAEGSATTTYPTTTYPTTTYPTTTYPTTTYPTTTRPVPINTVPLVAATMPVSAVRVAAKLRLSAPPTALPGAMPPTTGPPSVVSTSVVLTTMRVTTVPTTTPIPTTSVVTTTVPPAPSTPPSSLELVADRRPSAPVGTEEGGASWFGAPRETCAHKTLPKGTVVRVIRLSTGTETNCTVTDRGPYIPGRVIDLSTDTFARLASIGTGVIDVRIEWRQSGG
ncbi:MAG: septal ring lytic transglycosylase RlpA family protein [Pseudonocardiaceae bacterium]